MVDIVLGFPDKHNEISHEHQALECLISLEARKVLRKRSHLLLHIGEVELLEAFTSFLFVVSAGCAEFLALEQLLDSLLEVSGGRVADEGNLAFSVNEDDMGNALDAIVFASRRSRTMEVLDLGPALGLYVLDNGLGSLIDADANDADLVSPAGTVVLEHLLVVRHWLLARRAPSCPEVNQEHLAWLVRDSNLVEGVDVGDSLDGLVRSSDRELHFDLNSGCPWVDALEWPFVDFLLELFYIACFLRADATLNA